MPRKLGILGEELDQRKHIDISNAKSCTCAGSGDWNQYKIQGSSSARLNASTAWLHICNHHRRHMAIAGGPPVSRVAIILGQNSQLESAGATMTAKGNTTLHAELY